MSRARCQGMLVRLHRSTRPRHHERATSQQDERGAVLVEFALVAPLLIVLLFGIIDFSLVMFSYISVRQGTSAGAREAAVIATNPLASQPCLTAGSFTGEAKDLICYTKSHIGLDQSKVRVSVWFNTTSCNGPCYAAGDPVIVCTQYPASSATHFFSSLLNNKVLTSKDEIRIEGTDASFTLPAQEQPITSWPSSCSSP